MLIRAKGVIMRKHSKWLVIPLLALGLAACEATPGTDDTIDDGGGIISPTTLDDLTTTTLDDTTTTTSG